MSKHKIININVHPKQCTSLLQLYLGTGLVPFIHGSPGIGKSDIVRQTAKKYNLKVIDLRLSQCDPSDLNGFPQLSGKKATYLPMDTFPIESDTIPEGYEGWLLFLDEMNSAPPAVQAAAYKIVLDRAVGNHKLHPNVLMVCAGNLDTDNAIVEEMSTALQSRLCHINLTPSAKEWVDWGIKNKIHHKVLSYIEYKPDNLYQFSSNNPDNTFACPRTWEFVSKLLNKNESNIEDKDLLPLISGVLGQAVGREFIGFLSLYKELPSFIHLLSNPSEVEIPKDPSIIYALIGIIVNNTTKDNITDLMVLINRLPEEFQVVTLRRIINKNEDIKTHPTIIDWVASNAHHLMD